MKGHFPLTLRRVEGCVASFDGLSRGREEVGFRAAAAIARRPGVGQYALMALPARDLEAEVRRQFRGTPEERVLLAWRLGGQALDIFHATLPSGTTRAEARRILQHNKTRGRRPSRVIVAAYDELAGGSPGLP